MLEGGGCSGTACAGRRVLVGPTEVGIEELALLVRDPERMTRLARPRRWPVVVRVGLLGARVLAALGAAAMWGSGLVDPVTAGALLLVMLLGLTALKVVLLPPRGRKRDVYEENASLAVIGAVVPDPMAPFIDAMRRETASGPSPVLSGLRPATCPSCSRRLADGDAEDDEAAAWFCHHCGASLAPETDKAP